MFGCVRKSLFTVFAALALNGLALGQTQDQASPNQTPPSQTQPDSPEHVRVPVGVTRGMLVKKVAPKYPKKARKNHIEGTVVLHAKISKEGDIADLSVISGDPMLTQAALDAVKQWKYRPYLLEGKAVAVETEIRVNFQLAAN
jgi:periplasmic protein TonB